MAGLSRGQRRDAVHLFGLIDYSAVSLADRADNPLVDRLVIRPSRAHCTEQRAFKLTRINKSQRHHADRGGIAPGAPFGQVLDQRPLIGRYRAIRTVPLEKRTGPRHNIVLKKDLFLCPCVGSSQKDVRMHGGDRRPGLKSIMEHQSMSSVVVDDIIREEHRIIPAQSRITVVIVSQNVSQNGNPPGAVPNQESLGMLAFRVNRVIQRLADQLSR